MIPVPSGVRVWVATAKSGLIAKTLEIGKLKEQLARLRRMQFGRSSEKLDREIAQLELRLEELEAAEPLTVPPAPAEPPAAAEKARPVRRPLPEHPERREVVHDAACACPACGGELRPLGEDVTEVLEYEPARFHVVRRLRSAHSRSQALQFFPWGRRSADPGFVHRAASARWRGRARNPLQTRPIGARAACAPISQKAGR